MSAVEWLYDKLKPFKLQKGVWNYDFEDSTYILHLFEQAKQMEVEKCIQDYNAGYDDAQCNHINDAENYANEQKYINEK